MKCSQLLPFLLSVFILLGCSGKPDDTPSPKDPAPEDAPPTNFNVVVPDTTHNSAVIRWTKAIDPEGGKVSYSVTLGGREVASNLDTTAFLVKGLASETTYEGFVLARDIRNNSTRIDFSFKTKDPYTKFSKFYNHGKSAGFSVICNTLDHGYVMAGPALSDRWLVLVLKADSLGITQWEKTYDLNSPSEEVSMSQTRDHGFIIAAFKSLLRIDAQGNILWQTTLDKDIAINSVIETDDYGFTAVADAGRKQGISENISMQGAMLRFDAGGRLLWEKRFGTSLYSKLNDLLVTSSGGYILLGAKETSGITKQEYAMTRRLNMDFWVIWTDAQGNMMSQSTYGDKRYDFARQLKRTNDGGYVIAGSSWGAYDFSEMRIIKISSDGKEQWNKSFNNGFSFQTNAVTLTEDGGYALTGYLQGSYSYFLGLYKLDASGNKEWEAKHGRNGYWSYGSDLLQTRDRGYIVAGYSGSNYDPTKAWLLKLNPKGLVK